MNSAKLSRKILAAALATCMLGSVAVTGVGSYIGLSTTVNAAETTASGFVYEIRPDGTVTITGYCGSDTEIVIPSVIDGKAVTKISYGAFSYSSITSMIIPDSVKLIESNAFYKCSEMTILKIGSGVESIGKFAFYGCSSLTDVIIPDSVTLLDNSAFEDCKDLMTVKIGDGVTSIGTYAFESCTSLRSVTIGKSVKEIGKKAFYDCGSLTGVTLPDGVTSIGQYAFYNCGSLTSVTLPDSVTSIGDSAFYDCVVLTDITIPNNVTSIGDYTFFNCNSLTDITIPTSVTSIGYCAFYDCGSLTTVIIPDSVKLISEIAFYNCGNLSIYGSNGSFAESYALKYNIPFFVMPVNKSTISSTSINLGDTVTLKGSVTGGAEPYRYAFTVKHSTATNWTTIKSYDKTATKSWKPAKTGTYKVCAKVKDKNGIEVKKFFTLTVKAPLTNNSTISKTTINKGESITLTGKATGGTSPYQYAFSVKHSTATSWTTIKSYNTTATKTWTPAKTGTYQICAKVKDKNGVEVKKFFTLTVKAPLTNNSTISKTTINKGESVTLKAVATGGVAPYQYSFTVKHSTATSWTTIKSYNTTATKTWKPAKTGTYQVCAKVKDANGTEVKKFFTLTVK